MSVLTLKEFAIAGGMVAGLAGAWAVPAVA
jgi:hypothetical protein